MPRGLENWLALGFAGTIAPLLVSGFIQLAAGNGLAGVGFGIPAVLMLLALGLMVKNGAAGSFGKWVVLLVAITLLGMGGYELYMIHGEAKPVSPLPDGIVTFGWLVCIVSPWIAFFNLNGRTANDYFSTES